MSAHTQVVATRRATLLAKGLAAVLLDLIETSGRTLEEFAETHGLPLDGLRRGRLTMDDLMRSAVQLGTHAGAIIAAGDLGITCPDWCDEHEIEFTGGCLVANIHRTTVGQSCFGPITVNVDLGEDGAQQRAPYVYVSDDRSTGEYTLAELQEYASALGAAADAMNALCGPESQQSSPEPVRGQDCPVWCTDHRLDDMDPQDPGVHQQICLENAGAIVIVTADAETPEVPWAYVAVDDGVRRSVEQVEALQTALSHASQRLRKIERSAATSDEATMLSEATR